MNHLMKFLTVIPLLFIAIGCTQAAKKSVPDKIETAQDPTWNTRMSELRLTLSELGQFLYDEKKFNDPQNFDDIKRHTKKIGELAHSLDQAKNGKLMSPSSDPLIKYVAAQFRENIGRAYESLEADHREYARSVLRTSVSYCINCHTRSDIGPKFPLFDNPSFVSELRPMDQANYYAATRQYEAALKKYMDILQDPQTGKLRPFDIERAARSAMAIAIRVDRKPEEALNIAKYVVQKSETPLFVKNDSLAWIRAIDEWKKQKKQTLVTESEFVREIRKLLEKASVVQRYHADMKGDVYYLQATGLIHEYFNLFQKPKKLGEILFLAGQAYEPLQELGFWTLHEMYYEQCVREVPHTRIARNCYEKLEQSILLGYSGSAGIFVPISVQKQLKELYQLSF